MCSPHGAAIELDEAGPVHDEPKHATWRAALPRGNAYITPYGYHVNVKIFTHGVLHRSKCARLRATCLSWPDGACADVLRLASSRLSWTDGAWADALRLAGSRIAPAHHDALAKVAGGVEERLCRGKDGLRAQRRARHAGQVNSGLAERVDRVDGFERVEVARGRGVLLGAHLVAAVALGAQVPAHALVGSRHERGAARADAADQLVAAAAGVGAAAAALCIELHRAVLEPNCFPVARVLAANLYSSRATPSVRDKNSRKEVSHRATSYFYALGSGNC
eukprot:361414-Chlamydomonas_euryale.AAC.5